MSIKQKALTYLQTPNTRKSAKYVKKQLLGEMTESRAGVGKILDEPGASYFSERKQVLKTHSHERMSKSHRSQQRVPQAKDRTIWAVVQF